MSVEIAKQEIKRFIDSGDPEVLVIRGDWGIGKTFAWREWINENGSQLKLDYYSYVSLFGIGNVNELENSIFSEKVEKAHIENGPDIDMLLDNLDDILNKRKNKNIAKKFGNMISYLFGKYPWIRDMPFIKKFNDIANKAISLSIKDTLICFDDIERKNDSLQLKEIFGLTTKLKEHRNCKIIFIFNKNKLNKLEKKIYEEFREKVVDIELQFDITTEECIDLLWKNKDDLINEIASYAKILRINNMRILRQIERLARILSKILNDNLHKDVLSQGIKTLVLMTWCFYSKQKDSPKFSYIKALRRDTKQHAHKYEKKWQSILNIYEYTSTDDFDLEIALGVEKGYFNFKKLISEAEKLDSRVKQGKSKESFNKGWEAFYDSFHENEEEVIDQLRLGYYENYLQLYPVEVHSIIRVFRELNRDGLANEIIEHYFENRNEKAGFYELINIPVFLGARDEKFIKMLQEERNKREIKKSIKQFLQDFSKIRGFSPTDKELFINATENDFFNIFYEETGQNLKSLITSALELAQHFQVVDKVNLALIRVGKISKLNQLRISTHGINIHKNEPDLLSGSSQVELDVSSN